MSNEAEVPHSLRDSGAGADVEGLDWQLKVGAEPRRARGALADMPGGPVLRSERARVIALRCASRPLAMRSA
eukprot:3181019-Pyramimonas_sp.AAC.1